MKIILTNLQLPIHLYSASPVIKNIKNKSLLPSAILYSNKRTAWRLFQQRHGTDLFIGWGCLSNSGRKLQAIIHDIHTTHFLSSLLSSSPKISFA